MILLLPLVSCLLLLAGEEGGRKEVRELPRGRRGRGEEEGCSRRRAGTAGGRGSNWRHCTFAKVSIPCCVQ